MFPTYDVIVVGGGHAGCEAAAAAANMGSKVMLATMNMQTIAQMSCNPAMGGVAKGQIVREIDALGGYSGIVTDHTMVQFRMLNKSKGPAMWSPRAQSDRMLFARKWRNLLEAHPNVDFWQEMVTGIIVKDGRAVGVRTGMGLRNTRQSRRPDQRYFPEWPYSYRRKTIRRGKSRRTGRQGHHRTTHRTGLRSRPHENGHPSPHRRAQPRLGCHGNTTGR
jgi:choline dehydrogenase-like flavoprotein